MRRYNVFGIKLTSLQNMWFSKYLDNEGIAMNTLQPKERTEVVENWLKERLKNQPSE